MKTRDFKLWVEDRDIFGFEKPTEYVRPRLVDETPIVSLDCEIILAELYKLPLGVKQPRLKLNDTVEWGNGATGAVNVYISPLGSFKSIIRRQINDLQGQTVWICKEIVPFIETDNDTVEVEIAWAGLLYDKVKIIDEQMIEMPSRDYKGLERLAVSLAGKVSSNAPRIFIYEGLKRINDQNYIIYMSLRGQGVEAPGARRVEEFTINLNYKPEVGLIRCWGNDVSSKTRGHTWEIQPSEFDELFSPAQNRVEIERAIMNALSTY
jgi:hypothetical protein